jgi:hypothetical protein
MASVVTRIESPPAFDFDVGARGFSVVYRTNESNRCPGCGRSQWFVGRITAECGFCGTAIALAEAHWLGTGRPHERRVDIAEAPATLTEDADAAERRRHERMQTEGRVLQLLVDGAPVDFALRDISAGGAMGDVPGGLIPSKSVMVRFEGGILVPATVRWASDGSAGLAFASPVLLDVSTPSI